ncbi:hypothetical protein [Paenibacillus sp. NPDC058071]|uniref:hypothetical protein n=1 Tax=Paenibacillus sp. NPDC058071 TaxID=3346326 RepID=UPI0036DAD4AF
MLNATDNTLSVALFYNRDKCEVSPVSVGGQSQSMFTAAASENKQCPFRLLNGKQKGIVCFSLYLKLLEVTREQRDTQISALKEFDKRRNFRGMDKSDEE